MPLAGKRSPFLQPGFLVSRFPGIRMCGIGRHTDFAASARYFSSGSALLNSRFSERRRNSSHFRACVSRHLTADIEKILGIKGTEF
jgi:hypothetical protein